MIPVNDWQVMSGCALIIKSLKMAENRTGDFFSPYVKKALTIQHLRDIIIGF